MTYHPNTIARRGRVASIAVIALFSVLALRFFSIQVFQHAQFALRSDQNRLNEVPLPAPRGIIYDRSGLIIAENVPGYTVSILAPHRDSLRPLLTRIAKRVPLSQRDFNQALRSHELNRNRPAIVFGAASFELVSILEEHRVEFPGLIIQSTPKRFYPDSNAVSAWVGYTSQINEQELERDSLHRYKPGQQIGKAGLELQYESILRGQEGSRFVEVDALQRVVREAGVRAELAPVAAPPMTTNIDLPLQRLIAKLFADSNLAGAAVALDPETGAVLALHSAPGYDPNRFIGRVTQEYYSFLDKHPQRPLFNKAIQALYPPGSTWKLATAIMGLEDGAVTLEEKMPVSCAGGMQIGNRWFKCWDKGGHGSVNLSGAIVGSCDVYFYQLGMRLTLSKLVGGGHKMLFAARTGVDIPAEYRPRFPSVSDTLLSRYYKEKFGTTWVSRVQAPGVPAYPDTLINVYYKRNDATWASSRQRAEAANISIGQGANSQSVLNMARFYTALTTDGRAATPRIVGVDSTRIKVFEIPAEELAQLRKAMVGVTSGGGTAASAAIRGIEFAGKTGSAQNSDDAVRDHAWFVGFAPADKPRIVVAVMIEFGLHGYYAARVAKRIVEQYLHTTVTEPSKQGD